MLANLSKRTAHLQGGPGKQSRIGLGEAKLPEHGAFLGRHAEGPFFVGWVSERALADFCDCVGDVLGANPNIAPARMDAIVRKVRELAADVVFVSHR